MAIDRAAALRNAEKLLRQGKLDQAIAEYTRIVEDHPVDWNTRNTLGDLHVRAGQSERAVAEYTRIADAFKHEGFNSKAGALYRKILKIKPDDEHALLQGAEIAASQGLLVDARSSLNNVIERRRGRGDAAGALALVVRLGALDPNDIDARMASARAMSDLGDVTGAVGALKALADDLIEKQRGELAIDTLRQAAQLTPADADLRRRLLTLLMARGDLAAAAEYAADTGGEPALLVSLAGAQLAAGNTEEGSRIIDRLHVEGADRTAIAALITRLAGTALHLSRHVAMHLANRASAAADWQSAVDMIEALLSGAPHDVPALSRLVEVAVDGNLQALLPSAQGRLAEAHLANGFAAEARFITEDLVIRYPADMAHLERLRRVLQALGEPDVEGAVGECIARQVGAEPDAVTPPADMAPDVAAVPEPRVHVLPPVVPIIAPEPLAAPAPTLPDWPHTAAIAQAQHRSQNIEVDLSVVLDQIHKPQETPPSADLDDVFAQMRDEARRRLAIDAAEQDYRRGVLLFQAGQIDESIGALESASRTPRFRFEGASLLGRIFLNRGDLSRAVGWLERAVEAPAPSPEERHKVLYNLADALESAGETARALAISLELQSSAGAFRDVGSRIKRLSITQARG